MKHFNFSKKKIIILSSLVLLILLVILGLNLKSSNSVLVDDASPVSEETMLSFLEKANSNFVEESIELEHKEQIEVPKEEEKKAAEDPQKAIQANEKNKGIAKSTTATQAVKKYETNETSLGIDVSTWQGNIDWKKVKSSGITFAMIRVGFRGTDTGTIIKDNKFERNIQGALANNINVGIYFYSMARNEDEAREEAEWVYNIIKNYDISYPVAIDTEVFNQYRLEGVPYSTLTSNAIVFCDYIKARGYTPMIYSYANAFNKYFETARFKNYRIWLAEYNEKATYKGSYHMWQYTSGGSVPGISGRVDMNVAYFSVTNDITKQSIATGVDNSGDLDSVNFKSLDMTTTLTKTVTLRSSPYNNLPNKAGTLENGSTINITGLSSDYVRISHNGTTLYINDPNCFVMNLPKVNFTETNEKAYATKTVTLLSSPYNFLNNEVATLNIKEEFDIIGLNKEYTKISYNGETYYVEDVNFYEVIQTNKGSNATS